MKPKWSLEGLEILIAHVECFEVSFENIKHIYVGRI